MNYFYYYFFIIVLIYTVGQHISMSGMLICVMLEFLDYQMFIRLSKHY